MITRGYKKEVYNPEIHFNQGKPWSEEDIEYMLEYYKFDKPKNLEYSLGRTKKSITTKYWEIKNKKQK